MDTEPITLINVFEINTGDVEAILREWQQRAQPALYRVVLDTVAE